MIPLSWRYVFPNILVIIGSREMQMGGVQLTKWYFYGWTDDADDDGKGYS
jgi:hypothetical protein